MKRKKIALYDPYLNIMGGGERHLLAILEVLEKEGYEPYIFWDENLTQSIKERLNIQFQNEPVFIPNIFKEKPTVFSSLKKAQYLSQFEIFLYATDGSYHLSNAKKNVVFCMIPKKEMYKMDALNKLKTHNTSFIANSLFTQKNLQRWGVSSKVLYPFIEDHLLNIQVKDLKKENIILSVGRFFPQLHSKRQDVAIEMFEKLKKELPELRTYKLILAGGLQKENEPYLEDLKKMAQDDPAVTFLPNIPYSQLFELYKKSRIYWHLAGYEVDELQNPELTEHLGITPLEAMAAGCVDFCYRAGGLKELIQEGKNGFLFGSYEELKDKMKEYMHHLELTEEIQKNSKQYLQNAFSYPVFREKVKEIFV